MPFKLWRAGCGVARSAAALRPPRTPNVPCDTHVVAGAGVEAPAKELGWPPLFKFDALLVRPGLGDDRVI